MIWDYTMTEFIENKYILMNKILRFFGTVFVYLFFVFRILWLIRMEAAGVHMNYFKARLVRFF